MKAIYPLVSENPRKFLQNHLLRFVITLWFRIVVIFGGHGPVAAQANRNDNGVQDCRAKAIERPRRKTEDLGRVGFCEEPRDRCRKEEC